MLGASFKNIPKPLNYFFSVSQQSLLRQQERVEERVQEIEEQLCKLDSDKCVVEVCFYTPWVWNATAHILHGVA